MFVCSCIIDIKNGFSSSYASYICRWLSLKLNYQESKLLSPSVGFIKSLERSSVLTLASFLRLRQASAKYCKLWIQIDSKLWAIVKRVMIGVISKKLINLIKIMLAWTAFNWMPDKYSYLNLLQHLDLKNCTSDEIFYVLANEMIIYLNNLKVSQTKKKFFLIIIINLIISKCRTLLVW